MVKPMDRCWILSGSIGLDKHSLLSGLFISKPQLSGSHPCYLWLRTVIGCMAVILGWTPLSQTLFFLATLHHLLKTHIVFKGLSVFTFYRRRQFFVSVKHRLRPSLFYLALPSWPQYQARPGKNRDEFLHIVVACSSLKSY